ncbi:MAG: hypothetical protein JW882_13475 [Deltaproteobacteria bacterium]|nr:hypothetical protein [Deltaproteobacteria bacterium]
MKKLPPWTQNLYKYEEILDQSMKGIQLLIKTPDGPKAVWLSRKYIFIVKSSKEVLIPEWLCLKTGVIKEFEPDEAA